MKLGTQTASLVNHLQSRAVIGQPEPFVGMGVTLLGWTDRDAGTIQAVRVEKGVTIIEVTRDDAELIGGSIMSEDQEWKFTPDPNGHRMIFRRELGGRWQQVHYKVVDYVTKPHINADKTIEERQRPVYSKRLSKVQGGGYGLRIGERDKYRDPCF